MTSLHESGAILLVSCYELGHQPLGVAWPRAFLERAGYAPDTLDLAVEPLDESKVRRARLIAIAVPMHTALRVGVRAAERMRELTPGCIIVFAGLYAVLNRDHLLGGCADVVLGGEFEEALVALVDRMSSPPDPLSVPERGNEPLDRRSGRHLDRLAFPVPSRDSLPALTRYVSLSCGGALTPAGYVEASRGCLHHCLHCPIPPVYGGRFFAVPREVVLADIRQLVAAGAGHITFGDPDFLNGPGHALKLVHALHAEFPYVSYDFTAKIAHIVRHRELFPEFAATGCAFVVSAVESLSDVVLANLQKGHTRSDVTIALETVRGAGIALRPSFVPFTPWSTRDDYLDLLNFIAAERLIDHIDPVQLSIRLLVPPGSLLLERPAIRPFLGDLDAAGFTYRWKHPDPRMDELQRDVSALVAEGARSGEDPIRTFSHVWSVATARPFRASPPDPLSTLWRGGTGERSVPPRLTEPWFC